MFGILKAFYVLIFYIQIKRHSFDDVREEYFIINFISKSKTV